MAPHWREVAEILKMKTDIIGLNHHYNIRDCIREVMKQWMDDEPNIATTYSCTWKGLCEILDDIGLGKIRKELQKACYYMHLWT